MALNISTPSLVRILHTASIVCMAATPIIVVAFLILTPINPTNVQAMVGSITVSPAATPWQLWTAVALDGFKVAVLFWTFNEMRKLFASYLKGQALTRASAHLIERIGRGLLGLAVLPFVLLPIKSVLLSMANPQGERMLSVGVSSTSVGFALTAGLLIVIGWAMREAVAAVDENKAFV